MNATKNYRSFDRIIRHKRRKILLDFIASIVVLVLFLGYVFWGIYSLTGVEVYSDCIEFEQGNGMYDPFTCTHGLRFN